MVIRLKKLIAVSLISILLLCGVGFSGALSASAEGDTLTISVGYLGGEYEIVKTFTISELADLGLRKEVYTYFNQASKYGLPYDNPVLQVAEGVELDAIIKAAGIDLGSVQRLYFRANDGYAGVSDYTASFLFDMPRYYYPHLTDEDYWTEGGLTDDGKEIQPGPGPLIGDDAEPVTTMIALNEYGLVWGNDVDEMWSKASPASCPRLCFGMSGAYDRTNGGYYDSIKWVTGIDVMLAGSPPKAEGPAADEPAAEEPIGADPSNKDTVDRGEKAPGDKDAGQPKPVTPGSDNEPEISTPPVTEDPGTSQDGKQAGTAGRIVISALGDSEGDTPWKPFEVSPDSKPYKPIDRTNPEAMAIAIAGTCLALIGGAFRMIDIYYPQYRKKFGRK